MNDDLPDDGHDPRGRAVPSGRLSRFGHFGRLAGGVAGGIGGTAHDQIGLPGWNGPIDTSVFGSERLTGARSPYRPRPHPGIERRQLQAQTVQEPAPENSLFPLIPPAIETVDPDTGEVSS